MKLTLINVALVFALLFCGVGCEQEEASTVQESTVPSATTPGTKEPVASDRPRVVFLGDSLTAGLGVEADEAFPAVVGEMLWNEGLPVEIVNAGVSGDTTAGGANRIDWLLRQSPDVLVVGLGANDGLRGIDVTASEENLRTIIRTAREAGVEVLLLGMLIPPNYGPEYAGRFAEMYPRVAEEMDVPLVAFLLEGVGGVASLNQRDGVHPTAEGHRIMAATVLPPLRELVEAHIDPQSSAGEGESGYND